MNEYSIDWSKLSKKERKRLIKEQKKQELLKQRKKDNFGKWIVIGIVVLILVAGALWIVSSSIKESGKPLPGKAVPSLGRNHVPVGTKVKYNSNPPTSGDHYASWTKSGVYDKPQQDEYLVHSLEHGYVVISHNCEMINSKLPQEARLAKGGKAQSSKVGTESAEMDKSCLDFVKKLKGRVEKDAWKFILVPRPSLDKNFALTAWGRIDKFNIDEANIDRVNNFIDSFRNHGPEQTME